MKKLLVITCLIAAPALLVAQNPNPNYAPSGPTPLGPGDGIDEALAFDRFCGYHFLSAPGAHCILSRNELQNSEAPHLIRDR